MSTFSPANRIEEWLIISELLTSPNGVSSLNVIKNELSKYVEYQNEKTLIHACKVLSGLFYDSSELKNYNDVLCSFDNDSKSISLNKNVINLLKESNSQNLSTIKFWLNDLVQYNILRYVSEFNSTDYGFPFLKLYHTYTMRSVAPLCNYEKIHSSFRGQGLITAAKPDYFLFVNLHKNADVKESINYADKFITQDVFQWQSPNSTSQDSEIGQNLINNFARQINLHLFVRKFEQVEGITQPFTYLGKVITHKDSATGNKPITMHFALKNRVPEELYMDFLTRTDKIVVKE